MGKIEKSEAKPKPGSAGTSGTTQIATTDQRRGHDAPVEERSEDDLDRWPVARAIHRVIDSAPPGWSTRIGLYGRWGTGKTSVLNFLEQIETTKGSIVISFSAWSAVGEAGVVAQFYDELSDQLKQRGIDTPFKGTAKRWAQVLKAKGTPWAKVLQKGAEALVPGAGLAAEVLSGLGGSLLKVDEDDLRLLRESLGGKRVVVFIDDLDRADPRVVPKTLLALRELLDWPDFVFVLAFDVTVIAAALREYSRSFGDSAQQFLEKIIDVPFELPTLSSRQILRLSQRVLNQCCDFIPEEDRTRAAKWFPPNPRQSKLIARSLAILRNVAFRHDPGELNWHGIILQHVLRQACPSLATVLEQEMLGWDKTLPRRTSESSKKEGMDELGTELQKYIDSTYSSGERGWLEGLAREIIQSRESTSSSIIDYEMRLSLHEPCFTWKEFQHLLERWEAEPSDAVLNNELDVGAERGDGTRVSAAQEIVDATIEHYGNLLRDAARTTTRQALEHIADKAGGVLALLEQLWSKGVPEDLQKIAASNASTEKLFDVFATWQHFVANPADQPLRKREHELIKRAARTCPDKIAFYLKTGPLDTDKRYLWASEIREPILRDVVSQVLRWFTEPGGIMTGLKGKQYGGMEAWLIESSNSPLYRDEISVGQLTSLFDAETDSKGETAKGIAARNARDYLYALLGKTSRDSTWMGHGAMQSFVERHPTIVPAAWRLIVAAELQYRAKQDLIELHTKLGGVGVELEKLPMPAWLIDQPVPPSSASCTAKHLAAHPVPEND